MTLLKYLNFQVAIRVVADIVIVNVAYSAGLMLRLMWRITNQLGRPAEVQIAEAVQVYMETAWVLTLITLVVYGMSGFYSWGRFYRSRFKLLVIFQAVSLSYVLFGFVLYIALARAWLEITPRSVLLLGWLLTIGLTIGARWWAHLWRLVLEHEAPALRSEAKQNGRIQHVLVIGGGGYIGSVLCRDLLRKGYSVRVLDPLFYGRESLTELTNDTRFQLIEGDSRDVSDVFRAMLDMDAVVHLGELVGDPACALDEKLTLEINLAATRMVAEAAQGCGVRRFIYASSCSVYGASSRIVDERSGLNPISLYARAKIGSEQALLALNGPRFHPVILRFATVYGGSPRPRFDLVINLLTAKAVCDGEITIFGGEQWRPFVHVADVAQAIERCLAAPLESVKAEVFNVGSDEQNLTINEVGELIHRLIPQARLVNHGNNGDNRDYHVSFSRIRRELGFKPNYTVEDGVRQIEAALRAGLIANYQDKRYSNYLTLTYPANFRSISSRSINEIYAPPLMGKLAEG
jgi:nucleoside-diphosphate-sugar epimerase